MVNIVCDMRMYTEVWGHDVQCMQAQWTNSMGHRESIYRDKIYLQRTNHGPMGTHAMHVQKNNPIGTQGTCVYKGPWIGCTNRGPIL